MATIQKFLFETDFDADNPVAQRRTRSKEPPPPPPPPPPPTFSGDELEQARKAAFAKGHTAGKVEGHNEGYAKASSELQASLADASIRLADGVDQLLADRDDLNADRTGQPLKIALAILSKLLPVTIERHGQDELEAFIVGCLAEAVDEPRLSIKVAQAVLEPMRARIEALATQRGFGGRLIILGDAKLGASDARIEWAEGGAERNTEVLLGDLLAIAERMLGAHDAEEHTGASPPSGQHG
ncbi:MAG: hypothetical protein WCO00_13060 [Rhodospirillaceae bacterium]